MAHPELGDTLYKIEDDLSETWIEDYASKGIEYIDEYLLPYAAFLDWLDKQRPAETPHTVFVNEPVKSRQAVGKVSLSETVEVPFQVLPNYQSYTRY